jgi:hypothetical protein
MSPSFAQGSSRESSPGFNAGNLNSPSMQQMLSQMRRDQLAKTFNNPTSFVPTGLTNFKSYRNMCYANAVSMALREYFVNVCCVAAPMSDEIILVSRDA